MPKFVSPIAVVIGVFLATTVVVGGVRTSSARFSATTGNQANLWEAAELELTVTDGDSGVVGLFLDASGLYPGLELENCVVVELDTSLEVLDTRLHGRMIDDEGLGRFFQVDIEQGRADSGCDDFRPISRLFSGTLLDLTTSHPSYDRGIAVRAQAAGATPLRFSGSVLDDDRAQGLALDYMVYVEVRP